MSVKKNRVQIHLTILLSCGTDCNFGNWARRLRRKLRSSLNVCECCHVAMWSKQRWLAGTWFVISVMNLYERIHHRSFLESKRNPYRYYGLLLKKKPNRAVFFSSRVVLFCGANADSIPALVAWYLWTRARKLDCWFVSLCVCVWIACVCVCLISRRLMLLLFVFDRCS